MGTCSVMGCDRETRTPKSSLCGGHYFRAWRYGDTGVTPVRSGGLTCSVEGCASPHEALGMCSKHYQRFKTHGDPHRVTPRSEYGQHGMNYHTAHRNVRRLRGKASSQQCAHCDGAAHEWALDHGKSSIDETQRWQWSANPDHYIPLCHSCHDAYDSPSHGSRRAR